MSMLKLETFWEWYWDLYDISFGRVAPCPKCGLQPAKPCEYVQVFQDWYSGVNEYECWAPDADELDCGNCHHLICDRCRHEILFRKFKKEINASATETDRLPN